VKWRWFTIPMLAIGLMFGVSACNKNIDTKFEDQINDTVRGMPFIGDDTGLNVHAVRSIKQVIIHKIAVMPLVGVGHRADLRAGDCRRWMASRAAGRRG